VPDPSGHVPRAAAALGRAADAVHVLDIEDGPVRLGLAGAIATAAAGDVHRIQSTPTRRAA
jgi:Mg-chelatase subunit ChlD